MKDTPNSKSWSLPIIIFITFERSYLLKGIEKKISARQSRIFLSEGQHQFKIEKCSGFPLNFFANGKTRNFTEIKLRSISNFVVFQVI